MTETPIAVVDEHNRYLRDGTRHEVHIAGLWHRAIHCLVHDGAGRVFLSIRDDIVAPGRFDISVTEHLRGQESYAEAADRALNVRLKVAGAVPVAATDIFAESDPHPAGPDDQQAIILDNRFMQVFLAVHDGQVAPDPRVYSGGRWMTVSRVDAMVATTPERCASHFIKDWRLIRHLLPAGTDGSLEPA